MATYPKAKSSSSLDKLPVVELRPFVTQHQQWLPSKSRPDFYDRSQTSLSFGSHKSALSFRSYELDRMGTVVMETPRVGTEKPTVQRSVSSSAALPSSVPSKQPKAHTFAVIEKQKTMFEDLDNGINSPNREYTFFTPQYDSDLNQEEAIFVKGHKFQNDQKDSQSYYYTSHWQSCQSTKSEPARIGRHGGHTPRSNATTIEHLRTRIEHLENSCTNDNIYDSFDRAHTLPSLSVNRAPMRRRRPRNDRQPSAKVPGAVPYRLGVANSLEVLSHFGQPARVERHLISQLKNTINQLRRTKDGMSMFGGPRVLYKAEIGSTPGESFLRMATDAQQSPRPNASDDTASKKFATVTVPTVADEQESATDDNTEPSANDKLSTNDDTAEDSNSKAEDLKAPKYVASSQAIKIPQSEAGDELTEPDETLLLTETLDNTHQKANTQTATEDVNAKTDHVTIENEKNNDDDLNDYQSTHSGIE